MGVGIIEPTSGGHVPGTVRLFENDAGSQNEAGLRTRNLKHGKGKDKDMLLVPQPSASPNDPLVGPIIAVNQRNAVGNVCAELAQVEAEPDIGGTVSGRSSW